MLSRKEFFKDLLFRVIHSVNDFAAEVESGSAEAIPALPRFDLLATELNPSLLAIEAELRGIKLEAGKAEELQREIYQKMVQNLQNQPDLVTKGG
jgi:predicted NACHT family NTPase